MEVLVIGSKGEVGRAAVAEARARGHRVVADDVAQPQEGPVRHNAAPGAGSTVFDELPAAAAAADAVILAVEVRSTKPTHAYSEAVTLLGRSAQEKGRPGAIVALSSVRVETPLTGVVRGLWERFVIERRFRNPLLDQARMEAEIRGSGLRWTVVRAMPPGDGTLVREAVGARLHRPGRLGADLIAGYLVDQVDALAAADSGVAGRVIEIG